MSNSKNKALINYYAHLVQIGAYTMDAIPINYHDDIEKKLASAKPYVPQEGEFETAIQ